MNPTSWVEKHALGLLHKEDYYGLAIINTIGIRTDGVKMNPLPKVGPALA